MTMTREEIEYLLAVIRANDENDRDNDLEREPCFEPVQSKLVDMLERTA